MVGKNDMVYNLLVFKVDQSRYFIECLFMMAKTQPR